MITKAVIQSINLPRNRCKVRMPLFETASSTKPVEATAIISITPGIYNNLNVGDIVLVAFEENALEKPIIIGKLFTNASNEGAIPGGAGVLETLVVRKETATPGATTYFTYPNTDTGEYTELSTPKIVAKYVLWLEHFVKDLMHKFEKYFNCFKAWTQWQLRPENVDVDDGDLDSSTYKKVYEGISKCLYQEEDADCSVCENSTNCPYKDAHIRTYQVLDIDNNYSDAEYNRLVK